MGRARIPEGKGKLSHSGQLPDGAWATPVWEFFCQQTLRGELSSPSSPDNKNQFLCSWSEPLFLSCSTWRNPLPAAPALDLASAAKSFSQLLSQPCSKPFASPPTSFPKSPRVSWQKQWQALAWLPKTRPGLSLPSSFP